MKVLIKNKKIVIFSLIFIILILFFGKKYIEINSLLKSSGELPTFYENNFVEYPKLGANVLDDDMNIKILDILNSEIFSFSPQLSDNNKYSSDEMKGVWISYLDLDYLLKGKSESEFKENITKVFDNILNVGLNSAFIHVRPFSDSIYRSDLYPWSYYASGRLGVDPGYDPFKIIVDIGHSKNIKVHAWINPMRAMTDDEIQNIDNNYKLKQWFDDSNKRDDYIFKHKDKWYYNPAVPEVVDLIAQGAREIVKKYDVDGIHIDDYFYPSGTTQDYDAKAFERYKGSGGSDVLSEWRINNTNNLVKSMYDAIKQENPNVVFGVSPSGNMAYNINTMYCDPRIWMSNPGYIDYIAPQIYYGFKNSSKPFDNTVDEWSNYISLGDIKLVVGLAAYKIAALDTNAGSGKNEWIENKNSNLNDMMKNQIISSRRSTRYGGVIFYDYKSLFTPSGDIQPNLLEEITNFKGLLN